MTVRHLVFEVKTDGTQTGAQTVCGEQSGIPFNDTVHTMFTRASTCAGCLAVHSAWMLLIKAEEEQR